MAETQAKDAIKNIAILSGVERRDGVGLEEQVGEFLKTLGFNTSVGYLRDENLKKRLGEKEFDLVIALGGDGTVLRVGHLCAPIGVPLLAINQGHFGFLIEVEPDDWQALLPRLASGEYWFEERMLIHVELWRDGKRSGEWEALNEAMVGRGRMARPVHLDAILDGHSLTTYVADGLIISTATGSTAYALAVGGPILPPQLRNILLVPVAAHLSMDRAIVLDEGAIIRVEFKRGEECVLSVDGQQSSELKIGDWVEARASQHNLRFLRFQEPNYFYRRLLTIMDNNPSAGSRRT
ncbi:MAG: NAD(+)/NADH kinase [Anaerolineales bacterium]